MHELARYAWVEASPIGEAGCVSFVEGMDLAAVAAAFGGSFDAAVTTVFDQDYEPDYARPFVALRQVADWVVAIEDNGYEGSRPEVVRRLVGGRAVSCFWNVNAVTRFTYAERGTVVTEFEALFPDDRGGRDPDALEEVRAGLPWADDVSSEGLMFALAARMTGIVFAAEFLTGPMPGVWIEPWPDDLISRTAPGSSR